MFRSPFGSAGQVERDPAFAFLSTARKRRRRSALPAVQNYSMTGSWPRSASKVTKATRKAGGDATLRKSLLLPLFLQIAHLLLKVLDGILVGADLLGEALRLARGVFVEDFQQSVGL